MGRTKIYREGKQEVSGYLHPQEFTIFEEIRWREHKDKNEIVRQAIIDYIKAHAEGNDAFKITEWVKDSDFQAMPTFLSDDEKWKEAYVSANKNDRTRMRIKAIRLDRMFVQVEKDEKKES